MADGHKPMSPGEFEVALGELQHAIRKVKAISGNIQSDITQIGATFAQLHTEWRSPAEATSEPVTEWFKRVSADLHALLEETIRRMQVSYDNYRDAEEKNAHNAGGGRHADGRRDGRQQNNPSGHQHVAVQDRAAGHPADTALRARLTAPAAGTGLRNMVTTREGTDG